MTGKTMLYDPVGNSIKISKDGMEMQLFLKSQKNT